MMRTAADLTRREFLRDVGVASVLASSCRAAAVDRDAEPQDSRPESRQEALDALLEIHRNRVLALDGRIGGTMAHVPLALMALHRVGASPAQMRRFFGDQTGASKPRTAERGNHGITVGHWRAGLRTGIGFSRWYEFFDGWMAATPAATVLKDVLPVLLEGGVTAFDHALIHASYAIDHGEPREIASALATWAATLGAGPEIDTGSDAVEPDELLSDLVKRTSDLVLSPRGGNTGSINWRLDQVRRHPSFRVLRAPVRFVDADPLARFSEIIASLFCEAHEFTLLHALTTCQALRTVLPYATDPRRTLSAYWHSVCASYVSVRRMPQFDAARESVPTSSATWEDITARAAATDGTIHETQWVHRVKLVASCMLEGRHAKGDRRDLYRAVAAREVERASHVVLG